MTDRFAGFVVTLESDMRDDDAAATIAALRQIRGVVNVEPIKSGLDVHIAMSRVRVELANKLYSVLASDGDV